ncbi:hypothetical protein ACWD26_29365 [Streptomyces sp. NPDC002787]
MSGRVTTRRYVTKQYYSGGKHVPYIAAWSREKQSTDGLVRARRIGGEGIVYHNEDPGIDRHMNALWVRTSLARGKDEPVFDNVHAMRQRRAMLHQLCQVCSETTFGRDDERHLYLVRADAGNPIREGEKTNSPPVHPECAEEAVQMCPRLRKGYATALVERPLGWGVAGLVYDPDTLTPLPSEDLTFVSYDDERLRWTLAARLVLELRGVTPVRLEDVLTTAA